LTQYSNYHPNFRKRREEELQRAAYRCERCGVKHRDFAFNRQGQVFIVYLQIAHVFENERMDEDAALVVLCSRCHYLFDHPRMGEPGGEDWYFIGLVARRIIESENIERSIPHELRVS
jgi:hypothetical protein